MRSLAFGFDLDPQQGAGFGRDGERAAVAEDAGAYAVGELERGRHDAGGLGNGLSPNADVMVLASGSVFGELFEPLRDPLDGRLRSRDRHHEVVDVVVRRRRDAGVVDLQEDGGGEPAEALVAVDE